MYIGTYIPANPSDAQFTSWMPRQGDNAIFTYEEIYVLTDTLLTIEVYHKDSEDEGPGTSAGTINVAVGSSNYKEKVLTGLKELVRYKIACEQDGQNAMGAVYRILTPNWFNTARG